jgi:hypothetical protein
MKIMSKKFAVVALVAAALAFPATGALARGGGGGGGGHGGGGGGGHMGGGFGGGHMGGGFGGGRMGGVHIGGGFGGTRFGGVRGSTAQAFGSARVVHGGGVRGLHGHRGTRLAFHGRRRFVGRGFGYYDNYNPCWDGQYTAYGWTCQYPYY